MDREALLERLKEPFDLLVLGGGATGAGVLWEATLRGLKAALVEAGDFASGTSSRSTKLLHGGVRYLELAFKRETGRTINQEIVRIRIEKAKELLAARKTTIAAIAQESGFVRPNHLNRVFRTHTGVSPGSYRKKLKQSRPNKTS